MTTQAKIDYLSKKLSNLRLEKQSVEDKIKMFVDLQYALMQLRQKEEEFEKMEGGIKYLSYNLID